MKYLVLKDNFLWKKGAVLKKNREGNGYIAVDDDFNMPNVDYEYITSKIVENNPEWFEPIEDTVWEKFTATVEHAKRELGKRMRREWRRK